MNQETVYHRKEFINYPYPFSTLYLPVTKNHFNMYTANYERTRSFFVLTVVSYLLAPRYQCARKVQ